MYIPLPSPLIITFFFILVKSDMNTLPITTEVILPLILLLICGKKFKYFIIFSDMIKAYNKNKHYLNNYKIETSDYKKASLSLALVNALFLPSIIFLIGLSTVITIYLGGVKTIHNELDYGDIVQFIFYINMLTWPFASIGWVSSLIQRAAASQKRINEFIKIDEKIKNEGQNNIKELREIEFKNVHFKYPNKSDAVLKNIKTAYPQNLETK